MVKNKVFSKFIKDLPSNLKISAFITLILCFVYAFLTLFLSFVPLQGLNLILIIIVLSLIASFITPFFSSFLKQNTALHSKREDEVSFKNYLKDVFLGHNKIYKRIFNVNRVIINSVLFFVLGTILCSFIIYAIFYALKDAHGFYGLMIEIEAVFNSSLEIGEINTMINEILLRPSSQEILKLPQLLNGFITSFLAFSYFLFAFSRNFINFFLVSAVAPNLPPVLINRLTKKVLKNGVNGYYKLYFKYSLIPLLIYVISYTGTYFTLGYLLTFSSASPIIYALTSFMVSIALMLPFLPLLFNANEEVAFSFINNFYDYALNQVKAEVEASRGISNPLPANFSYDVVIKVMEQSKNMTLDYFKNLDAPNYDPYFIINDFTKESEDLTKDEEKEK